MATNNNLIPQTQPKDVCQSLCSSFKSLHPADQVSRQCITSLDQQAQGDTRRAPNHLTHLYFRLAPGQLTTTSTPSRNLYSLQGLLA